MRDVSRLYSLAPCGLSWGKTNTASPERIHKSGQLNCMRRLLCAWKGFFVENEKLSMANQSGKPHKMIQKGIRTDRVSACVYPDRYGCRGCEHSYRPDLFDGGCRLAFDESYYEAYMKGGAC